MHHSRPQFPWVSSGSFGAARQLRREPIYSTGGNSQGGRGRHNPQSQDKGQSPGRVPERFPSGAAARVIGSGMGTFVPHTDQLGSSGTRGLALAERGKSGRGEGRAWAGWAERRESGGRGGRPWLQAVGRPGPGGPGSRGSAPAGCHSGSSRPGAPGLAGSERWLSRPRVPCTE